MCMMIKVIIFHIPSLTCSDITVKLLNQIMIMVFSFHCFCWVSEQLLPSLIIVQLLLLIVISIMVGFLYKLK